MIRALLLGAFAPIVLLAIWYLFATAPVAGVVCLILGVVSAIIAPPVRRRPPTQGATAGTLARDLETLADALAAERAAARSSQEPRYNMIRPPPLRPERRHPDTITKPLPSRLAYRLPLPLTWRSPRYRIGPPSDTDGV